MNSDFLSKIDQDPKLASIFEDEGMANFIAIMQRDPAAAIKMYQSHPRFKDYMSAMQKLTGMIGDQIESSSTSGPPAEPSHVSSKFQIIKDPQIEKEDAVKKAAAQLEDPFEQNLVMKVLEDPGVRSILQDGEVQNLLLEMKTNPNVTPK
jgi:hypothetical protein